MLVFRLSYFRFFGFLTRHCHFRRGYTEDICLLGIVEDTLKMRRCFRLAALFVVFTRPHPFRQQTGCFSFIHFQREWHALQAGRAQ